MPRRKAAPLPFPVLCRAYGLPYSIPEYVFAKESHGRRWRFDHAWPEYRVALEIEGGIFQSAANPNAVRGRHMRVTGFEGDCEKYAAAISLGWYVVRASTRQVDKGVAFEWVKAAIERRKREQATVDTGLGVRFSP